MDNVGFTDRHLYQPIIKHTSPRSSIGKHMKQHGVDKPTIADNFSVLKNCRSKLDCLIYEMFFIQDLKLSLKLDSREATPISIIITHRGMPPDIHNSTLTFNDFYLDVTYVETSNNVTHYISC